MPKSSFQWNYQASTTLGTIYISWIGRPFYLYRYYRSAPFNIQDIGTIHVRLDSADGSTAALMRVTTVLEDATVFIVLNKENDDAWPFMLVNQTDEDMTFYQEVRNTGGGLYMVAQD